MHTSNSVYLTRPSLSDRDEGNAGVSAVALCPTLLELAPSQESAHATLKSLLPVYKGGQIAQYSSGRVTSKRDLFTNVAHSDGECEQAWFDSFAFECDSGCFLPTATVLHQAWLTLMSAALADDIVLKSSFELSRLREAVAAAAEDWPLQILEVVIEHLRKEPCGTTDANEIIELDRQKCVHWTGMIILQAAALETNSTLETLEFLSQWRNSLLEAWRDDVQLEAIKVLFSQKISLSHEC